MENASKALLMAGGVLIAIIIIALLVKTFSGIRNLQETNLTAEEQQQLVEFNEQYTKYLGEYVYGTEVISVTNRAFNNKEYKITIKIKFIGEYTYNAKVLNKNTGKIETKTITVKDGGTLNITNEDTVENTSNINKIELNGEEDYLKTRAFKCTNIGYDSYGRVNNIEFQEKKWGNLN